MGIKNAMKSGGRGRGPGGGISSDVTVKLSIAKVGLTGRSGGSKAKIQIFPIANSHESFLDLLLFFLARSDSNITNCEWNTVKFLACCSHGDGKRWTECTITRRACRRHCQCHWCTILRREMLFTIRPRRRGSSPMSWISSGWHRRPPWPIFTEVCDRDRFGCVR